MTSIAFTSLFLGLVLGGSSVEAIVEGPAAAVEFQLDGEPIARLARPPWRTRIQLGDDLSPHELVARALDASGVEVARTRQWLNLPRPEAEAAFVLERDRSGRAVGARLSWQSLVGSQPTSVETTFDGQPIAVGVSGRIELPAYDPQTVHLLSAEIVFGEGVRSRADAVLGGGSDDHAESELTAIPFRVGRKGEPKSVDELQNVFEKRGQPLRVVALENGPAQVLVVRDRGRTEASRVLGGHRYAIPALERGLRSEMRLARRDRVRFLWPVARHYPDSRISSDLFDGSRDFTSEAGGLHWLLTQVYRPGGEVPAQRFADATAVAGLAAAASGTRRAVVVVLGTPTDSSRMRPPTVRGYLEKVRVPLFVWSLVPPTPSDRERWGAIEDIGSPERLRKALRALKKEIESQRVAWFEGEHLPHEIALTEQGKALFELAK